MTHPQDDLIRRLEGASGPSRELDAEIFRAIGAPLPEDFCGKPIDLQWNEPQQCFLVPVGDMQVRYEQPRYTASLDAEMTLVLAPTIGWWSIEQLCSPDSPMRYFGSRGDIYRASIGYWRGETFTGRSDTPSIALCIAALKARRASQET